MIVTHATALEESSGRSKMPLARIFDADRIVMTMIEMAQLPSTAIPAKSLDSALEAFQAFVGLRWQVTGLRVRDYISLNQRSEKR